MQYSETSQNDTFRQTAQPEYRHILEVPVLAGLKKFPCIWKEVFQQLITNTVA
jgi:hypothetical protein